MRKGLSSTSIVIGLVLSGGTALLPVGLATAEYRAGMCNFDMSALKFRGTELEQAKCLLRPTEPRGKSGKSLAVLPAPFEKVIGKHFRLDAARFEKYLADLQVEPKALGGSIGEKLSRSVAGDKPYARYFVIHDVSLNYCEDRTKLPRADQPDAPWNAIARWKNNDQAHLYITRDGKLIAPQGRTFATPWYATKLEKQNPDRARGLFLHIENVQLRNVIPNKDGMTRKELTKEQINKKEKADCLNDYDAQKPGLTQIQYSRLALAYIAASHRAGKWLVPAYHLSVDSGINDGHDDPQNFDLTDFGSNVCVHLKALGHDECVI